MLLRFCLCISGLWICQALAQEQNRFHIDGQAFAHAQLTTGEDGWGNREPGKFIDGRRHYAFQADLDLTYQLTETLTIEGSISSSDADFTQLAGVTEAFLKWRPVPTSQVRHTVKLGSFYPPISLENTDSGWHSPFTTSFSTINTWVAEEIRVMGLEFEHSLRTDLFGGLDAFKLRYALFKGNDPAGSLLAWKGWSIHNRQSRIGEELPLFALPAFEPGQRFHRQANYVDAFVETNNKPGFYTALGWNHDNRFLFRATYYDNRANPTKIRDGQYGWRTRFYVLGLTSTLAGFDIIAQTLNGDTRMGRRMSGRHAVDNQFDSAFLLISRRLNKYRMTLRRDWFEVEDRDALTIIDPNQESGSAWTISLGYRITDQWEVETEWVSIDTRRPAWVLFGEDAQQRERQWRLGVRYRI